MADRLKQDAYLVDPTDGTALCFVALARSDSSALAVDAFLDAILACPKVLAPDSPRHRRSQLLLECGIGICAAAGSCRAPLAGLVNRVRERGGIGRCDERVVEPPDDEERDSPPEPDTNSNGRGNYDGGDEDG